MSSSGWNISGLVAVILGAGGGIGRELAVLLRKEYGCHLALCDINQERLLETSACVSFVDPRNSLVNLRTTTHMVDISKRDSVMSLAEDIRIAHGRVEMVFNTAGFASSFRFDNMSLMEFDKILAVNLGGVVNISSAFLPLLKESSKSVLLNALPALGAISGVPGSSAHSAAAFAIRGFTEALTYESAEFYPNVQVTRAFVGIVRNSHLVHSQDHLFDSGLRMLRNMQINGDKLKPVDAKELKRWVHLLSGTNSKDAAVQILEGVCTGDTQVFVGSDAKALDIVTRMFPQIWSRPWLSRFVILAVLLATRLIGRRMIFFASLLLMYRFSDQIQTQMDAMLKLHV